MKIEAEDIQKNYDLHIKIIETYISDETRKAKILAMIEKLGENYLLSPASGKDWYHGAYAGGYLVHVNNVVKMALKVKALYEKMGGEINFTEEELVFAALFHDLGKVGNGEQPNYIPNESEWHRVNQGLMFKPNPDIDFMLIPDRSLFLLQKFGIQVSQQEYLAIKLHDGIFDESNKSYFVSFTPDSKLKSNIVPILHVADYLAAKIELDIEKREG